MRRAASRLDFNDTVSRAIARAKEHDVMGLAAELAYRSALTVVPFLLVIAALPSVAGAVFSIDDIGSRLTAEIDGLVSDNSAEMLNALVTEVEGSRGWTPFLIGLGGIAWAGTMTTASVRKALNRIYGFEDDAPLLHRLALNVALTISTGVLILTGIVSMLVGPDLLGGSNSLTDALSLLVALVAILAAVTLIFWLAPAAENQLRWVTPGALVFCIGWLLFSFGFSIYLSQFGALNHVYGSLGVMVALLIWLYGSAGALLLGAELNAVVGGDRDPEVRRAQADAPSTQAAPSERTRR